MSTAVQYGVLLTILVVLTILLTAVLEGSRVRSIVGHRLLTFQPTRVFQVHSTCVNCFQAGIALRCLTPRLCNDLQFDRVYLSIFSNTESNIIVLNSCSVQCFTFGTLADFGPQAQLESTLSTEYTASCSAIECSLGLSLLMSNALKEPSGRHYITWAPSHGIHAAKNT